MFEELKFAKRITPDCFNPKETETKNVELNYFVLRSTIDNTIETLINSCHEYISKYGYEPEKLIVGLEYYQSLVVSIYQSTSGQISLDKFIGKKVIYVPDYIGFKWIGDNKTNLDNSF